MDLQNIYEELVALNYCVSAYQFSSDFLGMHKSYYGMLKASSKKPSTESLVNLLSVLNELYDNADAEQTIKLKSLMQDTNGEIMFRGLNKHHK